MGRKIQNTSGWNCVNLTGCTDNIRRYRVRKGLIKRLQEEKSEQLLWETIVAFQNYTFHTVGRNLPFRYQLKIGRDGTYNRELIINRCRKSKTLAWSSVLLAFEKIIAMDDVTTIKRPKDIGDIRGISYIYAIP